MNFFWHFRPITNRKQEKIRTKASVPESQQELPKNKKHVLLNLYQGSLSKASVFQRSDLIIRCQKNCQNTPILVFLGEPIEKFFNAIESYCVTPWLLFFSFDANFFSVFGPCFQDKSSKLHKTFKWPIKPELAVCSIENVL